MDIKRFFGNVARTYLVLGALSASSFVAANDYLPPYHGGPFGGPMDCCAPAGCCEYAPQSSCCGTPCNPAPACAWGYNPPAYLRCGPQTGCEGFFDTFGVRADFIYWRASAEGLALGAEETIISFPSLISGTSTENESSVKQPDFKFDPGFRLGLSHYSPCNCWDVALNWTHFHTKAKATGATDLSGGIATGDTYTVFIPFWERLVEAYPDVASGHWTLNADWIDLEFGHKYYVSNCFVLRPHIGLRGARLDQNYRISYIADRIGSDITLPGENTFDSVIKAKSNFLAIGPRIGLCLEFDLGCGFGLVGEGGASLLFGRFERHSREFNTNYVGTGTLATADTVEYRAGGSSNRYTRAATDLAIGLEWNHCFTCCNQSHPFSLAVMWEHNAFYNVEFFNFCFRWLHNNRWQNPTYWCWCCKTKRRPVHTRSNTYRLT